MLCLSHFAKEALPPLFLCFHLLLFSGFQRGFLLLLSILFQEKERFLDFSDTFEKSFTYGPALRAGPEGPLGPVNVGW